MQNNMKRIAFIFIIGACSFGVAYAAPAESVGSDFSEFNKIKRVQDTINLVHASPRPLSRVYSGFSVAKLPALVKLPAVSRLPAYPKLSALPATLTGFGSVSGNSIVQKKSTGAFAANQKSATKIQVLPVLPKEKSAGNKNWFGLVFNTKSKNSVR